MIAATLAEILAEASAALDGQDVAVTADPYTAAGEVAAGGTALLVLSSPSIEYTTVHQREISWTAWVILPRPDEPAQRFEPILDALIEPLALDRADAQTYDIADRTFPGYTLTFTTAHLKE